MPEHACATTLFPKDKVGIDKASDTGSIIFEQLGIGRHVTVGSNGWIMDIWDPVTKKTYNEKGVENGTRDNPFLPPETEEVRQTGYITYTMDSWSDVPTYLDMSSGKLPGFSDKTWEQLGGAAEITIDRKGNVIEVRDPETDKLYKEDGGDLVEFDARATTFPVHVAKVEVRSPQLTTYSQTDKDKFPEGSDAWHALNALPYRTITLDDKGFIVDIWSPKEGVVYNILGNEIGTRQDPYPSDTNIAFAKEKYQALFKEIKELRNKARKVKGAEKEVFQVRIKFLLVLYGQTVWLYGRLIGRRRRMKKAYDQKQTKSTTPQQEKE